MTRQYRTAFAKNLCGVASVRLETGRYENGRRKKGDVLFNDALNTFYLRLYGGRHMVKNHSDSERGKPASAT